VTRTNMSSYRGLLALPPPQTQQRLRQQPRQQPWARRGQCLVLAAAVLLLGGCASSVPQHFYVLGSAPQNALATAPLAATVMISALTIPEMVDRPQLVLRSGPSQVTVRDNDRWAESLRAGIMRVLAADMSMQLGGATVLVNSDRSGIKPAATIGVDIQRFESSLDAGIDIDAAWSVRAGSGTPLSGMVRLHEAGGPTLDATVAAHNVALGRLAQVLATAVQQVLGQAGAGRP
jgi:uncharacterized lipoprotein YmbA